MCETQAPEGQILFILQKHGIHGLQFKPVFSSFNGFKLDPCDNFRSFDTLHIGAIFLHSWNCIFLRLEMAIFFSFCKEFLQNEKLRESLPPSAGPSFIFFQQISSPGSPYITAFIACYYSHLKRLFLKGSCLYLPYFLRWTQASVAWPATGGGIFRNLAGHPDI